MHSVYQASPRWENSYTKSLLILCHTCVFLCWVLRMCGRLCGRWYLWRRSDVIRDGMEQSFDESDTMTQQIPES